MVSAMLPHGDGAVSTQSSPSCQVDEHKLQNCLTQEGQVTATPWYLVWLSVQMWQMVWQPGDGHQVRVVSRDTSVMLMVLDKDNLKYHYPY